MKYIIIVIYLYFFSQEIVKSLKEVATNSYGRKLLLYLLAPRDPLHFHPDVIKIMREGDDNEFR